jgi:hypothetical protein
MRLHITEIKIGDKIKIAYPSEGFKFVYYGEVTSISKHTIELKTFDGFIALPAETCRVFTDEPAPVYRLTGDKT